jgi:hypothetical protein
MRAASDGLRRDTHFRFLVLMLFNGALMRQLLVRSSCSAPWVFWQLGWSMRGDQKSAGRRSDTFRRIGWSCRRRFRSPSFLRYS